MKTKITSLALASFVALAGFSSFAQNNRSKNAASKARNSEVCAFRGNDTDECLAPAAECSPRVCDKTPGTPLCGRLLEGITLTPEQQAKVENLQRKNKQDFDKKMQQRNKKIEKKKEKQRAKAEKRRKEAAKKFDKRIDKLDKEMKNILTPEQYQQFKANSAKAKASRPEGPGFHKGHKPHKPHKGHKGHRPGKGPRSPQNPG